MPSNNLILCHSLSSCLQSFPASGSFPMNQLLVSGGQSFGASASASILPKSIQGWLISLRIDWLDLHAAQGTFKRLFQDHSSKASILQPSLWSNLHIRTWLLEKIIALTWQTFVGKVMSVLFNMLSRLVITSLPRSKCLLLLWLQLPSTVILEPKKIN